MVNTSSLVRKPRLAFRWFQFGFDIVVRTSLNPLFTTFFPQSALILGFYPYLYP